MRVSSVLLQMTIGPSGLAPTAGVVNQVGSSVRPLPLHFVSASVDVTLLFIFLSGLASILLVSAGAIAFARRRSRSFLLVALALGMLASKALVGAATIVLGFPGELHHTVEHGLDFVTATCLLLAVYFARRTSPQSQSGEGSEPTERSRAEVPPSTGEADD